MLLSSRKEPPRHLALPKPSSSQHLSIKEFLLHSPLPSPALPSILPRHGKKPPRLNSRRIVRYLCWLGILITLFTLFQQFGQARRQLGNLVYEGANGRQYEIIGTPHLPNHASPVAVTDKFGKARWTVSIPTHLNHPLPPSDYAAICSHVEDVASHVSGSRRSKSKMFDWDYKDPNFVDLDKARATGLLPALSQPIDVDLPLCERSLTYILDTSEAGLGRNLLGMWISWAIAKREHRAFLLDDTNFPFGNLSSLFGQGPPQPKCRPPSWEDRTPCPRQAKHLIVNAATLSYTFGQSFREHHTIKEIYQMAHEGYKALFKLRKDDAEHVKSRLAELRESKTAQNKKLIGVHIRRGDRHPFEFQYQHGYIPAGKYMDAARLLTEGEEKSTILLASDDADLYQQDEVNGTLRAQQQIRLASKKQLQEGGLGWEGGFFSDAFWSVGVPEHAVKKKHAGSPYPTKAMEASSAEQQSAAVEVDERDYRSNPTPEARQLREYIGRAYLLDLAVLAGSDDIVCGVSSSGCRVLGVMMGWDRLQNGHWRNVDGDLSWIGLV